MGNPAWDTLAAGTRQLVGKLLHRDPKRRYTSVDVLAADLAWWNEVLAQIGADNIFRRLDDRLWQARPAGRYDRVLAIAGLALQLSPPADARQSFEQSLKQAQEELDKENWQPIATAQVTLATRAYEKAVHEFEQQCDILPRGSEAVRRANIYLLLAGVGKLLRLLYQGMDERTSPEWKALEKRAIPALVQRRWTEAENALAEAMYAQSEMQNWEDFGKLQAWATAGVRYIQEVEPAIKAAENRADPVSDDWLQMEKSKIAAYKVALKMLQEVQNQAQSEPEFKERWEIETALLKKVREKFHKLYEEAANILEQAKPNRQTARQADEAHKYASAAQEYESAAQKLSEAQAKFQEVLDKDAAQRRAQLLSRRTQVELEQVQSLQRQATALHQAQQALLAHNYEQALAQTQAALHEAPGRQDALALESEIKRQQQTALLAQARTCVDEGHYAEAVTYVQQVLALAPAHREALAMRAEVETGQQHLERVSIYLRGAQTHLNNDEFESALGELRRFGDWDGRMLQNLPDGEALPQAVGVRPLRLPAELRTQTADLRQRIETTRDTRHNVDRAWAESDFAEVVSLCETLMEHYPLLTPKLKELYEEARLRLGNRQTALQQLSQAQDFDTLREAVRLIEADPGAARIYAQIAQQWLYFARERAGQLTTENQWKDLLDHLREGQRLFPSVAESFRGMHELVKRAQDLALPPNALAAEDMPEWLKDHPDYWLARLARVEEELADVLTKSQSWPQLQQLVTPWRTGLHQHLEARMMQAFEALERQHPQKDKLLGAIWDLWNRLPLLARNGLPQSLLETTLRKQLDELRKMARQKEFDAAYAASGALWIGFPENQRAEALPMEVEAFGKQLGVRRKADAKFDDTLNRLAEKAEYGFQEALAAVQDVVLPDHADVPKEDLEARQRDLQRAAPVEKLAALLPVPELRPESGQHNYAQLIRQCRQDPPELSSLAKITGVSERVTRLRELLPKKREDLTKALETALTEAVTQQQAHLETDPRLVLDLYQQAWWRQNIALQQRPSEAMAKAQRLPKVTLQAFARDLLNARNWVEFTKLEQLLQQAETLNNGLLSYESEALPPLPEKVEVLTAGQDWQLDASALPQLRKAFTEMNTHLQAADDVDPLPPSFEPHTGIAVKAARYANQVSAAQTLAPQIKTALTSLEQAWQALDLPTWQPGDSLAQLEAEIPQLIALMEHFAAACSAFQNISVMEGLETLSEVQQEVAALQELRSSLLGKLRQLLLSNYTELRKHAITALSEQIEEILPERDAAERLFNQVLTVSKSEELGEAAYAAILQGVTARVEKAQEDKRNDEIIRLWKVVMDATDFWADPDLDAAALTAAGVEDASKSTKRTGARGSKSADEDETPAAPSTSAPPPRHPVPAVRPSAGQPPKKPKMRDEVNYE